MDSNDICDRLDLIYGVIADGNDGLVAIHHDTKFLGNSLLMASCFILGALTVIIVMRAKNAANIW